MRIGVGVGVGFERGGLGAGGGLAPVIVSAGEISAQPLIGQVIEGVEPEVTGVTSTIYQWYRGAPTTTPIGGATLADYTPVDADYNFTLYRRATYTNAAGSTIEDLQAPAIVGRVFTEDWSGYTVGNTFTQLDTLYTRAATGVDTTVNTDAAAPAGKAVTVRMTTSAFRAIWRDADATFGIAKQTVTQRFQTLFVFRHLNVNTDARYFLRATNDGATNARDAGVMVDANIARLQITSDASGATAGLTLDGALVTNTVYCLRLEYTPTAIKGKWWVYGTAEPLDWQLERTDTFTLSPPAASFGTRFSASAVNMYDLQWWSSGYNTNAPFWPDYVPPIDAASDLFTYSAPASVTSVSFSDGDMVINLEDV